MDVADTQPSVADLALVAMTTIKPGKPPKPPTTAERFGRGDDHKHRLVEFQPNMGLPFRRPNLGMTPEQLKAARKAWLKQFRKAAREQYAKPARPATPAPAPETDLKEPVA